LVLTKRMRQCLILAIVSTPLVGAWTGCSQADNPKMTEAPPPPAPKSEELKLPTKGGKEFDPASNPRYKKFQESMAKQSGGR
jgi:hypothetical protein